MIEGDQKAVKMRALGRAAAIMGDAVRNGVYIKRYCGMVQYCEW